MVLNLNAGVTSLSHASFCSNYVELLHIRNMWSGDTQGAQHIHTTSRFSAVCALQEFTIHELNEEQNLSWFLNRVEV
jgi:hypothetical protein